VSQSILVVDDEPLARTMMRLILVRAGYEVVEAKDGPEALTIIENDPPDLVILDIMMPGMDGYEVCETLKDNKRTVQIPIVMLSARADASSIKRGIQVGASKYLTKPVMPDDLTRHVRELILEEAPKSQSG
jgi:CheY-like chemotaxis protein